MSCILPTTLPRTRFSNYMPIFISHSHQDKNFVDTLAVHLSQRKQYVWVDRWELNVGDSLIEKIQSAIKTASALIIVLSKASVASAWCKKELSAGLIRELEERRVVVLPVLLEDCELPLFLRDKKYADFRTDFDAGLKEILRSVAAVTSDTQGRIEKPEFHVDWSVAWGESNGQYVMHLRFISHGAMIPYCVLTEVKIICNDELTRRFHEYKKKNVEWFGRLLIVELLNSTIKKEESSSFIITNSVGEKGSIHFVPSSAQGYGLDAYITSVRLGIDTDMDTLVDWGIHIEQVLADLRKDVSDTDRERLRNDFSP